MSLKGVSKGWRSRMQALLHTLTKLLLHHMLDAFLLEFARYRHIGVDLRRSAILHRHRHLVETLEQWISLKIIVQQHPPQVWMASEPDAKEIIGLALQPVRGLPDRNKIGRAHVLTPVTVKSRMPS